jgi:hypothetical protein
VSVAVGFGLWIGAYVVVMYLTGWEQLATDTSVTGVSLRRNAATISTVLTTVYFAILWIRGIGGPILNFLYPILFDVFMPSNVLTLFRQYPGANPLYVGEGLNYSQAIQNGFRKFPAAIVFIIIIYILYVRMMTDKERIEFVRENMPRTPTYLENSEVFEKVNGDYTFIPPKNEIDD